ncbi:helix-turn-helix domain-containing protein [Microbispora sp. CA-102843]|uniref:helix-turn-helix domain-containing protein n=1 Tax=Microbispora sp. CA-102843 TaxID=3239952 RepID=UPI003D9369E9
MSGPLNAPPPPDGLTTPAEFVAALGRLRQWSGLTYRQLTAAAKASGDVLPTSTIAGALGRTTLPREEFVAAFVRACGLGEAETARWVAHRKRLAAGMTPPADAHDAAAGPDHPPGPREQPGPDGRPDQADRLEPDGLDRREQAGPANPAVPGDPSGPRRDAVRPETRALRRFAVAGAGVVVLLLATSTVLPELRASLTGGGARPSASPAAVTAGSTRTPRDGWYHIVPSHVAGRDLCIGEGRERNGRTDRPLAVQRPCRDVVPDTYLHRIGDGAHEIQWHHPKEGTGCLTVDEALTGPGVLIAPANCSGAPHQLFLLKPAGAGFALSPLHSGLCLGALYGEADVVPGAELAQKSCTGGPDQVFLFRLAPAPTWTKTPR